MEGSTFCAIGALILGRHAVKVKAQKIFSATDFSIMIIMENAASGVTRPVLGPLHRLWSLLFGCIYYAAKGCWGWAFLSFISANGFFIGFPLWNRTIIVRSYENDGWRLMDSKRAGRRPVASSEFKRIEPKL